MRESGYYPPDINRIEGEEELDKRIERINSKRNKLKIEKYV